MSHWQNATPTSHIGGLCFPSDIGSRDKKWHTTGSSSVVVHHLPPMFGSSIQERVHPLPAHSSVLQNQVPPIVLYQVSHDVYLDYSE